MKVRILAVCPYESLHELVLSVASKRDDVAVDSFVGDLSEGEGLWERVQAVQDQYDVIISRGGTQVFLKSRSNLPILDIVSSPIDLMRIVRLIRDYPGKCAITGSQPTQVTSHLICELMDANIDTFTFQGQQATYEGILNLREQGYQLIISGVSGTKIARSLGMNALLITSGEEGITAVLDEAVRLCYQTSQIRLENEMLRNYLDEDGNYIIIFDQDHNPIYQTVNKFSIPMGSIVKKLDALFEHRELSTHIRSDNKQYLFSGKICTLHRANYAMVRISPCYYIEPSQNTWITTQSVSLSNNHAFSALNGQSAQITQLLKQAQTFAHSPQPIVVHGEVGTGKEAIVSKLHALSAKRASDLITIDVSAGNKKLWESLLDHPYSPLNQANCEIHIKNAQDIPAYICPSLKEYLLNMNGCRLYFSWTTNSQQTIDDDSFYRFLVEKKSALSLRTPPLRERVEDLPSLMRILIIECNTQLGKQIFDIEDDALAMLQNYAWPYNFIQLRQLVCNAVTASTSPCISAELIASLMKELPREVHTASNTTLDLDRTLDEINADIIRYALEEENHNYTRTAARLGISRSSLWRKIKQ